MALIECTCAVLENVHVRQGRNYRQCSQQSVAATHPSISPAASLYGISSYLIPSDQGEWQIPLTECVGLSRRQREGLAFSGRSLNWS